MIKIRQGLDLPITGNPQQVIDRAQRPSTVAILGKDYIGMKPTMVVKVGEKVKIGQLLFTDKKLHKIRYTAPVSGTVMAINRGERRSFQSLVIRVEGHEEEIFNTYPESKFKDLGREKIINLLLESGLWPALRVRPFSKTANPDALPKAIFVTAIDTNPLAPDPVIVIKEREREFINGLQLISQLTDGKTYLCKKADSQIPGENLPKITTEEFKGPHPAGNVGTHIHFLYPVSQEKFVWYIGYQDVIAIGHLFATGKIDTHRIISLAGPGIKKPRLLKIQMGASLEDATRGELLGEKGYRIISGPILSGHKAEGPFSYLGRYHQQISVLQEGGQREFLGWLAPGFNKFSIKNVFLSKLSLRSQFSFDTNIHGDLRALVPIGSYERVMPLDIEPTFLLRALLCRDTDEAQLLGVLDLDEEDLALCTFVCPSKNDYGPILRENLEKIEKEG